MVRALRNYWVWTAALAATLVLVAGLTALAERYRPEQGDPTLPLLSIHSSRDQGARAIYLWLGQLGYRPVSIEQQLFAVAPAARALLVLAPTEKITEAQASEVMDWVDRGGTLVLVADRQNLLHERLGVEVATGKPQLTGAVPSQPIFRNLSLIEAETNTTAFLRLNRPEWVPILGNPDREEDIVAAVAAFGRGRAFVCSAPRAFSNDGIARRDNWALAMYPLTGVPAGSIVLFDEYHHGLTEHGTLGARLLRDPWGWAVLYGAGILFGFAALRGRRFGRSVPVHSLRSRRSRVEYVETMAGLLRQGGHRGWLCRQFAGQTKRSLASHYRLRADMPAGEFVASLASIRPEAAALAAPLERLETGDPRDDRSLLALVRNVDTVRAALLER